MLRKKSFFRLSAIVIILLLLSIACNNASVCPPNNQQVIFSETQQADTLVVVEKSSIVLLLDSLGLVDIQELDSSILVELKYATTDNFTGKVLYSGLNRAYLQPDVADKLIKAQQLLNEQYPNLHLLIYDAVRPLHIQQLLWESVVGTPLSRYVANPEKTGLHNYGAAVDLTLVDSKKMPLDMGTPYDYFGKKAGISQEDSLILQGLLTRQQVNNRLILRKVMRQAGFHSISGEWWHFNACSLSDAKEKYTLVN